MNRHFVEMGKRYDVTSKELIRTRRELKGSVDNLEKAAKKFLEKP